MTTVALIFAGLAALLHVFFFYLESVAWSQPATWKRFGLTTQAEADLVKPMALNQGFYNLFLAVGVVAGAIISQGAIKIGAAGSNPVTSAEGLLIGSLAMMLGAALVLVISSPKMWRAALIQGLFPALGIAALLLA